MLKKSSDYYSVQRRIVALQRHLTNGSQPEDFLSALKLLIKGIPLKGTTLLNRFLYRSRWNEAGRLYSHIDELKYPPLNCVKKKGRLNDAGDSVLYASLCELGAIIETRPSIDQLFTIAKIAKINDASLMFFPVGIVKKPFESEPKNKTEKMIFDYLHTEMAKIVQDEDQYNSTIAMGNFFLKTKLKWDLGSEDVGIAYPSAIGKELSNTVTYNLAMSPKMFDENYRIKEATVYFLSNEKTHYQLNPLNTANVDEQGNLVWRHTYEAMQESAFKEYKLKFN